VSPDASLYEAVCLLIQNKIHRLPIIDPSNGNVLYILNQKPLLQFLFNQVPNLQNFDHLLSSIVDAGVGTFSNIKVRSVLFHKNTNVIFRLQKKTQQSSRP